MTTWLAVAAIGLAVGFLAGLFGKGGSAIATPLLHAAGIPAIVAVAAPLPAAVPSTLLASWAYWRQRHVDLPVVAWSLAFGVPATIAGAAATRWISGDLLVLATDAVVAALGMRFLIAPPGGRETARTPRAYRSRLAAVATVVGVAAGLLANSGGFLLAPLYIAVLDMPVRAAFATSLVVAAALALPGTVVHAALGHIRWPLVVVFASTSVPLSYLGARVALRTNALVLERVYGAALAVSGVAFLLLRG